MGNLNSTTVDGFSAVNLLEDARRLADAVSMICVALDDDDGLAIQSVMYPLKCKLKDLGTIIDLHNDARRKPCRSGDQELLEAEQEYIKAEADWRALVYADVEEKNQEEINEALDKSRDILDRLFSIPASTIEGVAAKARCGVLSGWDTDVPEPDGVLALLADVKRLAASEGCQS